MITSIEEIESAIRCIRMGATDYLPKPFNADLLKARIDMSLAAMSLGDLLL
jgi:DNA-binding response OmpR family regulator